jgi:phage shock protein A
MQSARAAAEKTLKDEIARLTQVAQRYELDGAGVTSQLGQASKDVASLRRQLTEVSASLESERNSVLRLQSQLAGAHTASEVRSLQFVHCCA